MCLENGVPYKVKDLDIKNYAKYILKEGTDLEKREMLGCLRDKMMLSDKKVYLFQ